VAILLGGCAEHTIDTKALKTEAQKIASAASEGSILSDQLTKRRVKESFVQVEAADLADDAAKSQQDLEPALATPELKGTVEKLQSVAEDTSVELRGIETDPRDTAHLAALAKRLADLRDAASNVDEKL
jgi:ATP-dependent RNA circularization protein (DNA/RNA ligase family)